MSPDEFRLKTGLLGFTAHDLDSIFTELNGHARQVLNGHGQVPEHVGEVVSAWWEETTTAVANTVAEATAAYIQVLSRCPRAGIGRSVAWD
uniref:hypothetical protein n=1 Tax=Kocuria atrinae TaxID=592377 RepID=UPI001CB9448C